MIQEGFHVIYFSSGNVFDGESGNYTEESQTNPINKYGSMKAQMEQYLLKCEPEVCILRISKVVSMNRDSKTFLQSGRNKLKQGFSVALEEAVYCLYALRIYIRHA